jgi:F0F1-type ATP synthase membrane subunit b/b'
MNAEVVAALLDWFPNATAEQYLTWLHRELETLRGRLKARAADEQKASASKAMADVRQKIIDLIDRKADPATFEEEISRLSDYHAPQR